MSAVLQGGQRGNKVVLVLGLESEEETNHTLHVQVQLEVVPQWLQTHIGMI